MIAEPLTIDAIISRAEPIDGWMQREELIWLAEQASRHYRILEIGSYRGRSTTALAMATPGIVHCVDDFRGEYGTPDWNGDKLADEFHRNMAGFIDLGTVTLYRMTFAEFCQDARRGWYDMIFIDGTHEPAEAVEDDCRKAHQLVRPGGLIAGHDWGVGDVKEGVLRVYPNAGPVPGTQSIWQVPR